jgi:hypothetical protein
MTYSARAILCMLPCVAIATAACIEPDVTYGEHAVLRQRTMPAGVGGQAGIDVAGAAGLGGSGEIPVFMPPQALPDAGASDTGVIEADSGMPGEDLDPFPFCPAVPFQLVEPTAGGDGSSSGCELNVCSSEVALFPFDPNTYVGCTAIIGDLIVHDYYGSDLSALSCLEVVSGSLLILNAPNLVNLRGLDELQFVSEDLSLAQRGPFAGDVSSLMDITALAKLHVVLGSLAMRAPALSTLHGLEQLRAIGDNLEIEGAEALADLSGLSGLRAIGGDVLLTSASGLTSMRGLDTLETIGGTLHVEGTAALRTTSEALPAVSCIGGNIEIKGQNTALEVIEPFGVLDRVGGDVSITSNHALRMNAMLANVERIRGSIVVQDNLTLTQLDLSVLRNLGGVMIVIANPQLEECPLVELASALGKADSSQIHDNGRILSTGCIPLGIVRP